MSANKRTQWMLSQNELGKATSFAELTGNLLKPFLNEITEIE